MADQTLEAFGQSNKGLSWGELIVDNILGLDNEYESFGEKLGKAFNEDEIKFLKDAAIGVYESTKEFVQAPVETTKQVVGEIKDSVTRLGSEDLNTRLQRMYGVSYDQATDEQVNQAREAVLGDALTALELVPAAKGATTVAKAGIAAVPGGVKADVIGQTKAMLSGDREFLSGTPTPKADAQPAGAQVPGMFTPREEPKPEVSSTNTNVLPSAFDGLYGLSVEEGVPELANQDASFYSNLISGQEEFQIEDDFRQLTFENNANYGDEYNVMHNVTGNAYTAYVDDLADQVKQEVGRIFKERLQLIDAEQLLRLAALQRMHKQNGLQEGSNSAAEVMELAEGIAQTLNLTDNVRVYGPETYLGNRPFDAKVRTLDENGAIVDKKVSDLKGEDGKYLLKDLVGLGSTNRLNERFESIILDIVDSDNFLTSNSEIYAGSTTPQTFKSYIDYVINTENSFFDQTPYQGEHKTFRNINVEVLDEFLKKTSNKPVPLTGSRILSILQNDPRVNSKNIPKAIFEAEKDNVFDPSQAKELLELYSFQVKPKSQDNYSRYQRQVDEGLAIGIPKDYNELTLNVDPDNAVPAIQPKRRHFDQDTLVHTRYTVMEPDAPNLSDETRELLGDEDFILVEELQSDLLSGGYRTYKKLDFESLVNNRLGQASGPSGTTYMDDLKAEAGFLVSKYFDDFKDFAIKKFDDKYNNGVDVNSREYIKKGDQLIDSLSDKQEEWLKKSYPDATEEQINTAVVNFRSRARTFLYDMSDDEGKFHDTVLRRGSKTRDQAELNIEAKEDPFLYGTPPIKKNIEGVELNLQNLISRASQLGINKIVIPPFEKIASARFWGEELNLALKNQVRDKDENIKTGHRLYQTYVTDLEKALKKFEQSYPIKVHRDVDIPYQGQNSLSALPDIKYSDGLDLTMLKGIVIDISDMDKEFDLERPRFAEGGSVRPKLRPGSDRRISPKPRLRPDPERQYGLAEVEARADFDPAMHWNPIARLGFTGFSSDKTGKGNEIFPPAFYFPSTMSKKRAIERAIAREIPYDKALTVKPDDIYIAPELANKRVWTHEMTHRGFDRIIESINAHPDGAPAGIKEFKDKYGDDTFRLLTARTSKSHEGIVEMFDDLEDSVLREAPEEEFLDDSNVDEIKRFQKTIKRKPEDRWQINKDKYRPYIKLMEAAQDMLTKSGEPPKSPDYEESILDKLRIKLGFAEGGTVDMNGQMQMAFMNEGGLRDDGMNQDPVSGNEVPSGSMAKEVRDDIPAQLSEGEYVVPADVVRYYGVKFFEDLRKQAKMGLQEMEADGRIGGEPVPAGGPKAEQNPLTPEEMEMLKALGMSAGGSVRGFSRGGLPSWITPPPEGAIVTQAAVEMINPLTGESVMVPTGGYTINYDALLEEQSSDESSPGVVDDNYFLSAPLKNPYTGRGPLGSSLFRTQAEIDADKGITTTDPGDTGGEDSVTSPEEFCKTMGMQYDPETKMCVPLETTQQTGGDDGPSPTPTGDSTAWMKKFDYTDFDTLEEQTGKILSGSKIPFGGLVGAAMKGTNAAQAAANIIIMEAQGRDVSALKKQLETYINTSGLGFVPKEFINGDQLAKQISTETGLVLSKDAKDLNGNPIFKDQKDFDDHRTKYYQNMPGLSGDTAKSAAEILKEQQVMSQQVGSQGSASGSPGKIDSAKGSTGSNNDDDYFAPDGKTYKSFHDYVVADNKKKAEEAKKSSDFQKIMNMSKKETGLQANKGGLMTTAKKKKGKTRSYNKGGLATKK